MYSSRIVSEVGYESNPFVKGKSIIVFLYKLHSFVMLSCCRGLLWKKQLLDYIHKSLEGSYYLIKTNIKCSYYILEAESLPIFNDLWPELSGRESDELEAGRESNEVEAGREINEATAGCM
jgi:hypothetical protein